MSFSYRVGIVGATGAVGQELIRLLIERDFPARELKLYSSARSAGSRIDFNGREFLVEEATPEIFSDLDIALFSAGGEITKTLAPQAVERGCVVIDNSSAFRMDPEVPLIIPEINPHTAADHKGLIANPNCSTAVALMGLYPLHRLFGVKRFFAATYQAVSGTGAAAIKELDKQTRDWVEGNEIVNEVYPHQIAFNVLPHVDIFLEDGYTREELKMRNESAKIMEVPDLRVSCTCVRVPVFRAHSVAINAEFEKTVDLEEARRAIAGFPGSELVDDPENNGYPMPLDYQGKIPCGVGRLRKDSAFDNGISFWVTGDQLWKGAALNTVQIAELLHKKGLVGVRASLSGN